MRQSSKNFLWLLITSASLVAFLVALLAIGFHFNPAGGMGADGNLSDIISQNTGAGYVQTSAALLVSGLVVAGAAVLFVITKILFDIFGIVTKVAHRKWDIIFMLLIIIAAVLLIAGSANYIDRTIHRFPGGFINVSVDMGNATMLFLLLIIPIPFAYAPLMVDRSKAKKKREAK